MPAARSVADRVRADALNSRSAAARPKDARARRRSEKLASFWSATGENVSFPASKLREGYQYMKVFHVTSERNGLVAL